MISEQRMQRRTLNEILPLSQIIYVIGKNNLKCIFFMTYCQRIIFSAELGSGKSTFIKQLITHCHTGIL
jgi:HrpA-like RNA helicase